MAYKTADLEKQALEAIEKYKLFFIEDVVSFLPCDKTTFYAHKLNENNSIKESLEKNKVNVKVGLRKKWYESDAPATQIALYKLIGTEEESDRITNQKTTLKINQEMQEKIKTVYEELQSEPDLPESVT